MSTYDGVQTVNRVAGSAVTVYRFVVIASDGKYDHVGTTQTRMDGIAAESVPADADVFPMVIPNGAIVKVEAGATIAINDLLASDGVGKAIVHVTTAGNYIAGVALAAGVAGDIIEMQFIRDRDQA